MKINAFSQAKLIALLISGHLNCKELAEATGLHYVTILEYTRELYKANAVYIKEWQQDERGRFSIKVYRIGRSKDTAKPKMTSAEKKAAQRERQSQFKLGSHLKT